MVCFLFFFPGGFSFILYFDYSHIQLHRLLTKVHVQHFVFFTFPMNPMVPFSKEDDAALFLLSSHFGLQEEK